jgi:Zn ribbon nucleic-acid-binding protein
VPTCPSCENGFTLDELTRHDRDGVHRVHCPDCGHHLDTHNEHTH